MSDKWLKGVIYSNNLSSKDIEIKELKKEIEILKGEDNENDNTSNRTNN